MLKINYIHICDTAIVENSTGNISVIGIFENVNTTQFPSTYPQLTIVASFEADNVGDYDIEMVFSDKEGEFARMPANIKIGDNKKGNWIQKVALYPIRNDSTHKIDILHKSQKIFSTVLLVNGK